MPLNLASISITMLVAVNTSSLRFRLGDVLGSGSYAVVYHARNIMKDNVVAVKLKPITDNSSSVEHEYMILKQLEGGLTYHAMVLDLLGPSLQDLFLMHNQRFSLCTIMNLGDQLVSQCLTHLFQLSCLKYIHSYNYVHGDIKLQNVLMSFGNLKHTPFISLILVLQRSHHDDLELLMYMLIYFLCGCLPWLTDDHEKLSSSAILEHKVNTSIEVLCHGVPAQITTVLIYSCSLAFLEDPDYEHICLLLHDLCATLPTPSIPMIPSNIPIHS
ncbi:ser/thr kinase [Suillus ampliporus]|nr:ser/thr kinase [Suillus ampliporus]